MPLDSTTFEKVDETFRRAYAPKTRTSPAPSRARNVPSTEAAALTRMVEPPGQKSAFLWRLDTVSLGKHQRNGVEKQQGPSTPSQRIGAHAESAMTRPPCLCFVRVRRYVGRWFLACPAFRPHFFGACPKKRCRAAKEKRFEASTSPWWARPPLPFGSKPQRDELVRQVDLCMVG